MISKPSIGQMLRTVRRELLETVAPQVNDESVEITIGMIGTILHVAAERADGELSWMCAETEEIERVASEAIASGADDAALVVAHQRYLSDRCAADTPRDAQGDYDRASEMLSCLLEAGLRSNDSELVTQARGLLERRLQRELEIIGDSFYGVSA
jgi:hypothetical protein